MSLLAEISRKTEMEAICKKYASPIGETEQTRCERAERMIREAIDRQGNFSDTQKRNIRIFSQGSYRNGTNITTDSDVDVGICYFGSFFTDYSLSGGRNDAHFGNISATYTFEQFRLDVAEALFRAFGENAVIVGNKSLKIPGNTYRIGADAVPCFEFRQYLSNGQYAQGTRFKSLDGQVITNWPDHHYNAGVQKNSATSYRFKKVVRALKSLRRHMIGNASKTPSFLIESLAWNVVDKAYSDESVYENARNVVYALSVILPDQSAIPQMWEVNGIKPLFSSIQAWSVDDAKLFILMAGRELHLWQ